MTQLNKYSSKITQPASQGASQAMLYATGMSAEDMNKAQVGISSVWYEGNPCNMHLGDLAAPVARPDCRLHRNRHVCSMVRRQYLAARL